jgi:hypothetical protein
MSNIQNYQFFPAVQCWIKQLQEGMYNEQDKTLFTIFGIIKRVKLTATLIEKEEFISRKDSSDDGITQDTNINYRLILDDGTGIIYAIKWGIESKLFRALKKGDIINIVGKIRSWNNRIQVSIESLNVIDNPNYILLRDAKIIKKMKEEPLHDIPIENGNKSLGDDSLNTEEEFLFNNISDDIDIDTLFETTQPSELNALKEKIFSIIEEFSQKGNGITLSELRSKLTITEEKLRIYIKDLEMESRIYQSEENLYQSF